MTISDYSEFTSSPYTILALVRVAFVSKKSEVYFVSLKVGPESAESSRDKLKLEPADFSSEPLYWSELLQAMISSKVLKSLNGNIEFKAFDNLRIVEQNHKHVVSVLAQEQSNSAAIVDNLYFLKHYRRPESGKSPDIEVPLFLRSNTSFKDTPKPLGEMSYTARDGGFYLLAAAFEFVANSGSCWEFMLEKLRKNFAKPSSCPAGEGVGGQADKEPLALAKLLGSLTKRMHTALGKVTDDKDFSPEPVTQSDLSAWAERCSKTREVAHAFLGGTGSKSSKLSGAELNLLTERIKASARPETNFRGLTIDQFSKIRIHGDYHLGQVLLTPGGLTVIDFEGEPARSLQERRAKQCALVDVAGMVRSLDYACSLAFSGKSEIERTHRATVRAILRKAFIESYLGTGPEDGIDISWLPKNREKIDTILGLFEFEKALYELSYELNNRPDWTWIPAEYLLEVTSAH